MTQPIVIGLIMLVDLLIEISSGSVLRFQIEKQLRSSFLWENILANGSLLMPNLNSCEEY